MNTAKHTPGPWEVTGPHSREVITTNPGTYKPCMTIAKVGGYWDGEAQANAHLIAVAPAMYAWIARVCKDGLSFEDIKEGRALLSQAEGVDHA